MSKITAGDAGFDMDDISFADARDNGAITNHNDIRFVIETPTQRYILSGTNFTYTLTSPHHYEVTGGTVTGMRVDSLNGDGTSTMEYSIGNFSVSVAQMKAFIAGNDVGGFESSTLNGDDILFGSAGNDHLVGLSGNDEFNFTTGGSDIGEGGKGNDLFSLGAALTAADRLDGGSGHDSLHLNGDYSAGLTLKANTIHNIETISFNEGFSYNLKSDDGNVAAGKVLALNAHSLHTAEHFYFDGSAETDGSFNITGGNGQDHLFGGQLADKIFAGPQNDFVVGNGGDDYLFGGIGDDTIIGGDGADQLLGNVGDDTLTGGAGADFIDVGTDNNVVVYGPASDSTGNAFDTVSRLHFERDHIDVVNAVTAIDASASTAFVTDYNTSFENGADAAHLGAHHAMLLTVNGAQSELFMVIDQNGVAGYQEGGDIVFKLVDPNQFAAFTAQSFI